MQRSSDHRTAEPGRADARARERQSELLAAFMRQPIARHGAELQALLNEVRDEPLAGHYVLVCVTPHREWRLARLPGRRGAAVEILDEPVFTSIDDAERHVFSLRWRRRTGAGPGVD